MDGYDRGFRAPRGMGYGRGRGGGGGGYGEDLSADAAIERELCRRLRYDDWVDERRIRVSVEAGVVLLTGEVDDFIESRYAWDDAWETAGVRGVINHLTAREPRP